MKTLQDIFNSDYDKRLLTDGVLKDTFGDLFTEYEFAENFLRNADDQDHAQKAGITSVEKIGHVSGFDTPLSVFEITLAPSVRIKYSRVNIQKFLRRVLYGESAFLIFHYENVKDNDWRFSFLHVERGNTTAAKRFTYLLGKAHKARTVAERFEKLKNKILEQRHSIINDQVLFDAFSVEALTQEFYGKLYNWYLWAVDDRSKITFPNRTDTDQDDRENIQTKMLRLITRLMFVWFIKQKRLVPDSLFDTKTLGDILRNFDPQSKTEGNYYNAILQNLFFATLNQEITDRQFISDKIFQGKSDSYTIKNLYRDDENESWFTFPDDQKKQRVMQLFETVPYLNGGLFDCLDKFKNIPETGKSIPDKLYDGFSSKDKRSPNGNLKYRAFVPNCFFFAPEHKEIVKEKIKGEYKDQEKNVCGLIELFGQYNFTVEENSPDDSEVSLDPELLGKVFENLLAAYNPETQDSARKSTGSYYTPREIVDYMVNESLINYLTVKCGHQETAIRALFDDHQPAIPDNAQKVASDLRNIRILDPACGSGAFPMGILLRITTILERLQLPDFNKYQTKIELIKNCIFGIDIQPIAMLICKLRFFITLICDSEYKDGDKDNNFGIIPLPSLETKFVAANSLLPAEVRKYDNDWTQDDNLLQMKQELIGLRKKALEIRSYKARSANHAADLALCDEIEQYIISTATQPDPTKIEQWQREIEKAKAELPKYQHEQWVDETVAQQTLFEIGEPSMFRRDVNAKKRDELLSRIHNCEDAIARERSKSAPSSFAEAIRQVAHWNPYAPNTVSPFFDADWMFGVTEGFDIVIGNPPYVESRSSEFPEKLKNDLQKKIKSKYSGKDQNAFSRGADLLIFFYEQSLELLNNNGINVFVTENAWLSTDYGKSFQQYLLENIKVLGIVDTDYKYFENAEVNTVITFFKKKTDSNNYMIPFYCCHDNIQTHPCNITNIQNKNNFISVISFNNSDPILSNYKWGFLYDIDTELLKILNSMTEKTNKSVSDCIEIGQGLNITKDYILTSSGTDTSPYYISNNGALYSWSSSQYYVHNSVAKATRRKPMLILPRGIGTHFCCFNEIGGYSASYVEIYEKKQISDDDKLRIWLFCNSSLLWLLRECSGRTNLGGGMLKAEATDLKSFPLCFDFPDIEEIRNIYEDAKLVKLSTDINETLQSDIHKRIDKIVFSYFGVSSEHIITDMLIKKIERRTNKSKKIKKA